MISGRATYAFVLAFLVAADFCAASDEAAPKLVLAFRGQARVLTLAFAPSEPQMVVFPVATSVADESIRQFPPNIVDRLNAFSSPRVIETLEPNRCGQSPGEPTVVKGLEQKTWNHPTSRAEVRVGNLSLIAVWAQELGLSVANLTRRAAGDTVFAQSRLVALFSWGQAFQIILPGPETEMPPQYWLGKGESPTEALVFVLSQKSGWEVRPNPGIEIATGLSLPSLVLGAFDEVYRAAVEKKLAGFPGSILEYEGTAENCSPCAGPALTETDFQDLGAIPISPPRETTVGSPDVAPSLFLTRLRTKARRPGYFSEIVFEKRLREHAYRSEFIVARPFKGKQTCESARVPAGNAAAAMQNLLSLTDWPMHRVQEVAAHSETYEAPPPAAPPGIKERISNWWGRLWR